MKTKIVEFESMPLYYICKTFELRRDNQTLWVNGVNGLMGRYSKGKGIDVHANSPGNECLGCKTGKTSFSAFVHLMIEHHCIALNALVYANS